MQEFDFNLDRENFEIFPKEIWEDPNVVFHGTSEYHSSVIESIGLIPSTSPFDLNDARELVNVLKKSSNQTTQVTNIVSTLNNYIAGIENKHFRLSFAYLSCLCLSFSTGLSKGGQVLRNIRNAKSIILDDSLNYLDVKELITEPIKKLFELENDIANTDGVVYAISLNAPYTGITEEYGIIYSNEPVPTKNIIGKVILPNNIEENDCESATVKQMNRQKLIRPNHLGIILNRLAWNNEE